MAIRVTSVPTAMTSASVVRSSSGEELGVQREPGEGEQRQDQPPGQALEGDRGEAVGAVAGVRARRLMRSDVAADRRGQHVRDELPREVVARPAGRSGDGMPHVRQHLAPPSRRQHDARGGQRQGEPEPETGLGAPVGTRSASDTPARRRIRYQSIAAEMARRSGRTPPALRLGRDVDDADQIGFEAGREDVGVLGIDGRGRVVDRRTITSADAGFGRIGFGSHGREDAIARDRGAVYGQSLRPPAAGAPSRSGAGSWAPEAGGPAAPDPDRGPIRGGIGSAGLVEEALDVDDHPGDPADGDQAALVVDRHREGDPAAVDLLDASPRPAPCGPTAVGARWSSWTRMPTVVSPGSSSPLDRRERGFLAQRDRRGAWPARARAPDAHGERGVRLGDDAVRLRRSGRVSRAPGYDKHPLARSGQRARRPAVGTALTCPLSSPSRLRHDGREARVIEEAVISRVLGTAPAHRRRLRRGLRRGQALVVGRARRRQGRGAHLRPRPRRRHPGRRRRHHRLRPHRRPDRGGPARRGRGGRGRGPRRRRRHHAPSTSPAGRRPAPNVVEIYPGDVRQGHARSSC